jgi:hypothetical protein
LEKPFLLWGRREGGRGTDPLSRHSPRHYPQNAKKATGGTRKGTPGKAKLESGRRRWSSDERDLTREAEGVDSALGRRGPLGQSLFPTRTSGGPACPLKKEEGLGVRKLRSSGDRSVADIRDTMQGVIVVAVIVGIVVMAMIVEARNKPPR